MMTAGMCIDYLRWTEASLLLPNYPRVGRVITMFTARKVMSTACMSTRGSEARGVNGFTRFIIGV